MKIYTIEFKYFSGVAWADVIVDIKAKSVIQLMKSFIETTEDIYPKYMDAKSPKAARKELWSDIKGWLEEENLPVVIKRS
jgi:hypothetical protein